MKTMENKQCCGTCEWCAPYEGMCYNSESEHIADYITPDTTCENWEKRKVKEPDDLSEEWTVLKAAGVLKEYCEKHFCSDCLLRTAGCKEMPVSWKLPEEP